MQDLLNVDVRVIDNRVIVGAEPGTTAMTSGSGLLQSTRTLALRVPLAGVGPAGIQDGNTFLVDNGTRLVTFEFDTGNGLNTTTNLAVPVANLNATEIAVAIRDAVAASGLGLNPSISADGLSVYLNLPLEGTAIVPQGQLTVVGLSRTPIDGDTLLITPNDGSPDLTLEINRTDEPDMNGDPMDDGVTVPNVPINVTRSTTGDELAGLIANAIQGLPPIAGLSLNDLQVIPGGLLVDRWRRRAWLGGHGDFLGSHWITVGHGCIDDPGLWSIAVEPAAGWWRRHRIWQRAGADRRHRQRCHL